MSSKIRCYCLRAFRSRITARRTTRIPSRSLIPCRIRMTAPRRGYSTSRSTSRSLLLCRAQSIYFVKEMQRSRSSMTSSVVAVCAILIRLTIRRCRRSVRSTDSNAKDNIQSIYLLRLLWSRISIPDRSSWQTRCRSSARPFRSHYRSVMHQMSSPSAGMMCWLSAMTRPSSPSSAIMAIIMNILPYSGI